MFHVLPTRTSHREEISESKCLLRGESVKFFPSPRAHIQGDSHIRQLALRLEGEDMEFFQVPEPIEGKERLSALYREKVIYDDSNLASLFQVSEPIGRECSKIFEPQSLYRGGNLRIFPIISTYFFRFLPIFPTVYSFVFPNISSYLFHYSLYFRRISSYYSFIFSTCSVVIFIRIFFIFLRIVHILLHICHVFFHIFSCSFIFFTHSFIPTYFFIFRHKTFFSGKWST